MMAHTSGMRDSLDLLLHAAGPGVAAAPDIHLRTLAALDSVNLAPGADWSYNNGAYALLTEIVTPGHGRPFADFLLRGISLGTVSCRVRVWKSVSISGVAVSLKKKQH